MFYFNLLASQSNLTYYYQNASADSQSFSFIFTASSARMTHFVHDYSSLPIQQQLNDSTNGDSLVYVQAMAGEKKKNRLPNLKQLLSRRVIGRNKARH